MIVTAQQPIVFIIGDDASVRDGFEDLLRSVGLGAQSFRSTGEFLQSSRPDLPGCMSDCRGRVDWNFSVHWRKRGSNSQSYSSASWRHSHVGEGNAIGRDRVPHQTRAEQELLDAVNAALERDRARRNRLNSLLTAGALRRLNAARTRSAAACDDRKPKQADCL